MLIGRVCTYLPPLRLSLPPVRPISPKTRSLGIKPTTPLPPEGPLYPIPANTSHPS